MFIVHYFADEDDHVHSLFADVDRLCVLADFWNGVNFLMIVAATSTFAGALYLAFGIRDICFWGFGAFGRRLGYFFGFGLDDIEIGFGCLRAG